MLLLTSFFPFFISEKHSYSHSPRIQENFLILFLTSAEDQTPNHPVSEFFHLLNGCGVRAGAWVVSQSDLMNLR